MLGDRQKSLLKLLLKNKAGMSVDEMSEGLSITRNAVRQHLATLENEGLLKKSESRGTRGRPEHLYILTDKGHECFPRHYAWFAQLLIESMQHESGTEGLDERLTIMGQQIGKQLYLQHAKLSNAQERVQKMAELMHQLGYDAEARINADQDVIEADNCVFHTLAFANPHICKFDLALMEEFTGRTVEHQECMATNGQVCRFKFKRD